MRKKIPALTAAIALGTATMTTGAMAFGHGGGGGHLGGGGAHFAGAAHMGGIGGARVAGGHLCQRMFLTAATGAAVTAVMADTAMAHTDGLGLGLGLGGLYAYADNPYCGYPYYDYNYAYCGPYDYG